MRVRWARLASFWVMHRNRPGLPYGPINPFRFVRRCKRAALARLLRSVTTFVSSLPVGRLERPQTIFWHWFTTTVAQRLPLLEGSETLPETRRGLRVPVPHPFARPQTLTRQKAARRQSLPRDYKHQHAKILRHCAGRPRVVYFAVSMNRDSRTTVTLISPG